MKYLLIFAIKSYQSIIPNRYKKTCIFSESCSRHVLRVTTEEGFVAGKKALKFRVNNCKQGYVLVKVESEMMMITKELKTIREADINKDLW